MGVYTVRCTSTLLALINTKSPHLSLDRSVSPQFLFVAYSSAPSSLFAPSQLPDLHLSVSQLFLRARHETLVHALERGNKLLHDLVPNYISLHMPAPLVLHLSFCAFGFLFSLECKIIFCITSLLSLLLSYVRPFACVKAIHISSVHKLVEARQVFANNSQVYVTSEGK